MAQTPRTLTLEPQERADTAVCSISRALEKEPHASSQRITEVTAEYLTDDPVVDDLIMEQVHEMRVIMGMDTSL